MWFSLPLRLNEGNQARCLQKLHQNLSQNCSRHLALLEFLPRHAEQFPCGGSGSSTASELWQMRTCQWGLKQGMSQKISKLRNLKFSKGVHFISRKLIFSKPSRCGNSVIVIGSDHTMVMANLGDLPLTPIWPHVPSPDSWFLLNLSDNDVRCFGETLPNWPSSLEESGAWWKMIIHVTRKSQVYHETSIFLSVGISCCAKADR